MKLKTSFCKGKNPNTQRIYSPEVIEILEQQLSDKIQRSTCMIELWRGENVPNIILSNVAGIVTDYEWDEDEWLVIEVRPLDVPEGEYLTENCVAVTHIMARVWPESGEVMADDFKFIKFGFD